MFPCILFLFFQYSFQLLCLLLGLHVVMGLHAPSSPLENFHKVWARSRDLTRQDISLISSFLLFSWLWWVHSGMKRRKKKEKTQKAVQLENSRMLGYLLALGDKFRLFESQMKFSCLFSPRSFWWTYFYWELLFDPAEKKEKKKSITCWPWSLLDLTLRMWNDVSHVCRRVDEMCLVFCFRQLKFPYFPF